MASLICLRTKFVWTNPGLMCACGLRLVEAEGLPRESSRVIPSCWCCGWWCFLFTWTNKVIYLHGYRVPFLLDNCYYLALDRAVLALCVWCVCVDFQPERLENCCLKCVCSSGSQRLCSSKVSLVKGNSWFECDICLFVEDFFHIYLTEPGECWDCWRLNMDGGHLGVVLK